MSFSVRISEQSLGWGAFILGLTGTHDQKSKKINLLNFEGEDPQTYKEVKYRLLDTTSHTVTNGCVASRVPKLTFWD